MTLEIFHFLLEAAQQHREVVKGPVLLFVQALYLVRHQTRLIFRAACKQLEWFMSYVWLDAAAAYRAEAGRAGSTPMGSNGNRSLEAWIAHARGRRSCQT